MKNQFYIQEAFIQALRRFLYTQPEQIKEYQQPQTQPQPQHQVQVKTQKGLIQIDNSIQVKLEEPSNHDDQSYTFESSDKIYHQQQNFRQIQQNQVQNQGKNKIIKSGNQKQQTKEQIRIDKMLNDLEMTQSDDDSRNDDQIIRPYKCDFCHKRYKSNRYRQYHLKRIHNPKF
ncbi:hypothetical protein pb186bvf_010567 [Paramecium bursaria]